MYVIKNIINCAMIRKIAMKPSLKPRPTNGVAFFPRKQIGPLPFYTRNFNPQTRRDTTPNLTRTLKRQTVPAPSSTSTALHLLPSMGEQLVMRGTLEGHSGWVTSLATSLENPHMLLSGSRDKTLIIWNLARDDAHYGYPKRSLHGHSHIVSDCVCLTFFFSSSSL